MPLDRHSAVDVRLVVRCREDHQAHPGGSRAVIGRSVGTIGLTKIHDLDNDRPTAAQMAVRRDSKGFRLPVVFIAGEAIGGRSELTNLATSGDLRKKVFG